MQYTVTVSTTRTETYVVHADDPDDVLSNYWDGNAGDPIDEETVGVEIMGVDPIPELTIMEDEDRDIVAIFCPHCAEEVYEWGVMMTPVTEVFTVNDCGTLIQDPTPIFDRYNRQD